jgi:hypothetical protein
MLKGIIRGLIELILVHWDSNSIIDELLLSESEILSNFPLSHINYLHNEATDEVVGDADLNEVMEVLWSRDHTLDDIELQPASPQRTDRSIKRLIIQFQKQRRKILLDSPNLARTLFHLYLLQLEYVNQTTTIEIT